MSSDRTTSHPIASAAAKIALSQYTCLVANEAAAPLPDAYGAVAASAQQLGSLSLPNSESSHVCAALPKAVPPPAAVGCTGYAPIPSCAGVNGLNSSFHLDSSPPAPQSDVPHVTIFSMMGPGPAVVPSSFCHDSALPHTR